MKLLIERGTDCDRDLDGLAIRQFAEFQFRHEFSPLAAVRPQHQVLVNDDAQRPTGPYFDRRLNIEVLLRDLLPGLIDAVLRRLTDGRDEIALLCAAER